MFENMPVFVMPMVALVAGLIISGPGLWFLAWLGECRTANMWVSLPFEPKYITVWIASAVAVAIALATIPGELEKLTEASWYGAVALGMSGEALIGKLIPVIIKRKQ